MTRWFVACAVAVTILVGAGAYIASGPKPADFSCPPAAGPVESGGPVTPDQWLWHEVNDVGGGLEGVARGVGPAVMPNRVYGPCTVVRALDGDTIEMLIPLWSDTSTRRRVRVWGCDTPERKAETMDGWRRATEYTRQWLGRHFRVVVEHKGDDSLGRSLCVVYGEDADGEQHALHADLIANGHAVKRESR